MIKDVEPYKKGKKRNVLEPKNKTYLVERTESPALNENELDDKSIVEE